jgi:hypothetical protein
MTLLRSSTATVALAVVASVTLAVASGHAAEDGRSQDLGPWEIETIYKGDKLDHCSINRSLQDDIVARFVRTTDDMTLELESPKWKLERGKNYPVKIAVGSLNLDAEVAAEPQSVSLDFDNKKLESALRNASTLNIVAAGATIRVPLDKSSVAFDALAKCVEEKAETVAAANIFCAPATSATASGMRDDQSAECKQDAGASEDTTSKETTKAEESKPAEDVKPLRRVKSKKFRSRPIPAFFAEMFDAPLR